LFQFDAFYVKRAVLLKLYGNRKKLSYFELTRMGEFIMLHATMEYIKLAFTVSP